MALYEHIFLARQDLSQAQVDALAASATEIVEKNEGKVTKTETWGLKSLAYKIDRNRKAHFVLLNIDAPGSVVEELERQTRINEDVIRYNELSIDLVNRLGVPVNDLYKTMLLGCTPNSSMIAWVSYIFFLIGDQT